MQYTKKTDPEGQVTLYEYDNYGLPKSITLKDVQDAQGNLEDIVSSFAYEYISGWKLWEKNPRGYVTEYQYDPLGRTTQIIAADDDDDTGWVPAGYTPAFRENNPVTSIQYDDNSLYSVMTDPLGRRVMYDFDNLGQLVKEVKYQRDEAGNYQEEAVTTLEYDGWGNITAITDPNGNSSGPAWKYTTHYQYDALGLSWE